MTAQLKRDEYLGAVKFQGEWHLLALYVGEWILDYPAYDPSPDDSPADNYRHGLLVVSEKNAGEFLEAMREHEMSLGEVKSLIAMQGAELVPLTYVVNFDDKLFVDGHPDRDIAEYVPEGWTGVEDFPTNYVPPEIKSLWQVETARN